jgi:hypothetical protein
VIVTGASDDLIEFEGDITDEFHAPVLDGHEVLAFSDGTMLGVRIDDEGIWRFHELRPGDAELEIVPAGRLGDEAYSDRVTLKHPNMRWCVLGTQRASYNPS